MNNFTDESYAAFQEAALEKYDFTTCQRPDGSKYGSTGRCIKGSETSPASEDDKKSKGKSSGGGGGGGGGGSSSGSSSEGVTKAKAEVTKRQGLADNWKKQAGEAKKASETAMSNWRNNPNKDTERKMQMAASDSSFKKGLADKAEKNLKKAEKALAKAEKA